MNLLVNKAPDYITVGGKKLSIKTDFALWISFVISCENNDTDGILKAISDIFEEVPPQQDEFISACMEWLFPDNEKGGKKTAQKQNAMNRIPFDFEVDGNVIYCELWEYFPHLMERGISFHEGIELIKLLLHNENTMMWHRAFARCGDFSKMDKEQQKYWRQQRAQYRIKNRRISQEDRDKWLYNAF